MGNLNLLVFLNSYADSASSNNPSQSNFKWTRNISGIAANNPFSLSSTLAPGTSQTLFSGSAVKKFIYLESDQPCTLLINGTITENIKPFVINNSTVPGIFVRTSDITSLVITNPGSTAANIFLAAIE